MTVPHISKLTAEKHVVKPIFFDLNDDESLTSFQNLVKTSPNLIVSNQIESQLMELMKINHPRKSITTDEALELAEKHVGHSNFMTYGNWVHYPWLNTLVHLLPKDEFIKTRTSRNNYKISPEEQTLLATKKVGVIGLSVGQSISVTMAMERVFGVIRIADFDELELTNLNRIRAGVHQLGIPKVALVAREIAEIDPYLKVECFWDGITKENIDDFLLNNGKIDLVADECDTIHIKFLARDKCKKHQIPVIMDTSDRGMLDIERFDLEPNRSLFHGLVDHLDIEASETLKTTEEKVAYTLPIIGLDKASKRIKASMLEIDETITTWPQLSSDVSLGGAISTNVIRRIFLNQLTKSGRYYVDTNSIIPDSPLSPAVTGTNEATKTAPLEKSNLKNLAKNYILDANRISPEISDEKEILKSALYAPSGANCQPWKWLVYDNAYFLFHDKHYSESFNDFEDLASSFSLGCATENFILASHSRNYRVKLSTSPFGNEHPLKAVLQIFDKAHISEQLSEIKSKHLSKYIFDRHTNRKKGIQTNIASGVLKSLSSVAHETEGANLRFIQSNEALKEIGQLVAMADKIKMLNPQCHKELFENEIRLTPEENFKHRDGIDIDLVDVNSSEKIGIELCADPEVMSLIKEWKLGESLGKMSKELVNASSSVGFLTMKTNHPEDFFNAGRSIEKTWLKATELNIAFQPITILPYYFTRLIKGKGAGLSTDEKDTLTHMWLRFNALFPTSENNGLIFLFRLSEAAKPTKQSLRRSFNDIVHFQK